jgi:hypothetical protein
MGAGTAGTGRRAAAHLLKDGKLGARLARLLAPPGVWSGQEAARLERHLAAPRDQRLVHARLVHPPLDLLALGVEHQVGARHAGSIEVAHLELRCHFGEKTAATDLPVVWRLVDGSGVAS